MQVDLNKVITDIADALTSKSLNFKNKAVKSSPWLNVRTIDKLNTSLPTELMPGTLAPGNQ